jgi:hypothetical protein
MWEKLRMRKHSSVSLIEHFQNLPDPRVNRTKEHELIDVLVIGVCCLPCAGESFNDMEDFGLAKEEWFIYADFRCATSDRSSKRLLANLLEVHGQELFIRQLGDVTRALETEFEIRLAPNRRGCAGQDQLRTPS